MWALTVSTPLQATVVAGAGGYFSPLIRGYMRRSGAPEDTGIRVALKDRTNALKNPYAHLREPDISFERVASSPMLWDPIRFHETCPSSDGACAMVLSSERALSRGAHAPAWVHSTAMRSEPTQFAGQEKINPLAGRECAKELYRKAGIREPRKQIDAAEIYVPFSWFEPMWMENLGFAADGDGWKMTYEGATALDGDMPVNCSGGVLSSNPIGASGMLRFAEAAMQVRGQAGEHQIDGARIALGHAYGGGSQFFSMWIVGSAKP
jgi:acetyl-CoA C-acetyltransferase